MCVALDRILHGALIATALSALAGGAIFWTRGDRAVAQWAWAVGSIPVILGLLVSIVRDLLAGRAGVGRSERAPRLERPPRAEKYNSRSSSVQENASKCT